MLEYKTEAIGKRRGMGLLSVVFMLVITHALVAVVAWNLGAHTIESGTNKARLSNGIVTELEPKEAEGYIKKVASLIAVPKNEVPKVIVLNNVAEIVKQQPFFASAQNGDIFLAYNQSKKAIVYRPSENIIINVGPIYDDPTAGAGTKNQATSDQQKNTNTDTDSKSTDQTTDKKPVTSQTPTSSTTKQ